MIIRTVPAVTPETMPAMALFSIRSDDSFVVVTTGAREVVGEGRFVDGCELIVEEGIIDVGACDEVEPDIEDGTRRTCGVG